MSWINLDFHFRPKSFKRYAAVPFAKENDSYLRIFYSNRDSNNRSILQSIDVELNNNQVGLIREDSSVLLGPGDSGFFDDGGVMGCHITNINGTDLLYYIGWNLSVNVPFRNAIGIAEYTEGEFKRMYNGPILDRSIHDPAMVASNCVFQLEDGKWIMYYLSCDKWDCSLGEPKHKYNIKIAHSSDGINWQRTGKVAIDYAYPGEYAISVPRVLFENHIFKMWYSYREGPLSKKYRIGYAESENGIDWIRKDDRFKSRIGLSEWDNEMQCYPFIFNHKNEKYLLYNGNGYGKTGFGIAKWTT